MQLYFRFVDLVPCVNGTWNFLFYSEQIKYTVKKDIFTDSK